MNIRSMNLELTTACPLRCPQCYCSLNDIRHMDINVAKHWIDEAKKHNVSEIALSGGETLCYPNLFEVISYAREKGINSFASFSGWHFTEETVQKLIDSGIGYICISLNGSTEKINSYSRQGYDLAIQALEALKASNYKKTIVNWVMHSNNVSDFDEMLRLCEFYDVYCLDVISFKPDSHGQMKSIPSKKQITDIVRIIRKYTGKTKISVEGCYSPMRAVLCETKLFGNLNTGMLKGCAAGRHIFSVNVDGSLSPCRHLDFHEKFDSLQAYWEESLVLKEIRSLEKDIKEPCQSCRYLSNCRHCLAINNSINGKLFIGNSMCDLWR